MVSFDSFLKFGSRQGFSDDFVHEMRARNDNPIGQFVIRSIMDFAFDVQIYIYIYFFDMIS